MDDKQRFYLHFSTLISQARLKKGYATLKELYREKEPDIDYQTWLNAESGRRLPSAAGVICIADALGIEHLTIILAYCRDKFPNDKSQQALDMLSINKFIDIDSLLHAEDHNRSRGYVFNNLELEEMQQDVQLRLFLSYTYENDLTTTVQRLSKFFGEEVEKVRKVVARLEALKLVEVAGDSIKKNHKNTRIPRTIENFSLRKQLLIKSLERTLQPDSYLINCHMNLTDESYRKVIAFLEIVNANLIRLSEQDDEKEGTSRFQIAIAGNKLSGKGYDE